MLELNNQHNKEIDRLIRESRLRNPQLWLKILFAVVFIGVVGVLFFGPTRAVSFQKVNVREIKHMTGIKGPNIMLVVDTGNGILSVPSKDRFGRIVVGDTICLRSSTGPILKLVGSTLYTVESNIFCQ